MVAGTLECEERVLGTTGIGRTTLFGVLGRNGFSEEECTEALNDEVACRLADLVVDAMEVDDVVVCDRMDGLEIAEVLEGFGGSSEETVDALEAQIELLTKFSSALNERFSVKVQQKERMSILETSIAKEFDTAHSCAQSLDRDVDQLRREMSVLLEEYIQRIEELEDSFTHLSSSLQDVGSESSLTTHLSAFWKQTDDLVDAIQEFMSRSCNSLEIQDANPSQLWKKRLTNMKEVSRLQHVYVLTEMERIDAVVALEEIHAAHETAAQQLEQLRSNTLPPLDASRFEGQVVTKQKQITDLQLRATALRDGHLAPLLDRLKEYACLAIVGAELRLSSAANAQLSRHHTLAADCLASHRACVDILATLLQAELLQQRTVGEQCADVARQLYRTSASVASVLSSATTTTTQRQHASGQGAAPDAGAVDGDKQSRRAAMMALFVALGGQEDALSAGWLSDKDVLARAEEEGRGLGQSERLEEELRRRMWGEQGHLGAHCGALLAELRRGVGEGESALVTTPAELKAAMRELEEVKGRLDERLQELQRRRQEPRHALPNFFVDFFLRPEVLLPLRI